MSFDFEDYDLDNDPEGAPDFYDVCPQCGDIKQARSKVCLKCYRANLSQDKKWKGSKAWRDENTIPSLE